jgi:hypothetical protein
MGIDDVTGKKVRGNRSLAPEVPVRGAMDLFIALPSHASIDLEEAITIAQKIAPWIEGNLNVSAQCYGTSDKWV